MTTHAEVQFCAADGTIVAAVYLHANGYKADDDLDGFFTAVAAAHEQFLASPHAYRFHQPDYLAARFVAYMTGGSLIATGVGVITPGTQRVHHVWRVTCHEGPSPAHPKVEEITRA